MLLAENGHTVTLWSYLEEESRRLQQTRENPPSAWRDPAGEPVLHLGPVLRAGLRRGGHGHPSFGVRPRRRASGDAHPETILVSVSKGIEKGVPCMTEIIARPPGTSAPVVPLRSLPRRGGGLAGAHRRGLGLPGPGGGG